MEITISWTWWQCLLAILGAVLGATYIGGVTYFIVKGTGLFYAVSWPIFFIFGGVRAQ